MVSASSRRRAVKWVVEGGLGNAAQACRALGLARSSYYWLGQKRLSSQKLEREIIALSEEHPRYRYRRITALMRRKGKPVNAKRVQRGTTHFKLAHKYTSPIAGKISATKDLLVNSVFKAVVCLVKVNLLEGKILPKTDTALLVYM